MNITDIVQYLTGVHRKNRVETTDFAPEKDEPVTFAQVPQIHVPQSGPSDDAPLTLASALDVLQQAPRQHLASSERRRAEQREQRAFRLVLAHLARQDVAQHPVTFMPELTLIARRLCDLSDPLQSEQGLALVERSLAASAEVELAVVLASHLGKLPRALQERGMHAVEGALARTVEQPYGHADILIALTEAMHAPACRDGAYALLQAGLLRLRARPELCGEIRRGMSSAFTEDSRGLSLVS